jgi:hypothetical protein
MAVGLAADGLDFFHGLREVVISFSSTFKCWRCVVSEAADLIDSSLICRDIVDADIKSIFCKSDCD